MLTQVEVHGAKLSTLGRSMQEVTDQAGGATGQMAVLEKQLSTLEARATSLEDIGSQIEALRGGVGKVEKTAQKLLAPNGDLQKHRHEVQQLSAQATQNVALLDAMKKEQDTLDELRERLRVAQTEVEDSASKATSLKTEFDRLSGLTGKLTKDHARLKDSLRETREQAGATTEAVRDVEKKLGPLAEMHELSKSTETRLATLNSLAEHVLQKVKVLENQKHTVEHAVVEANRLNEMVWNMDVQIAKIKDGGQQAAQVEETVTRIEALVNETVGRLDQATQAKESFSREIDKLEQGRAELVDFVRGSFERLTVGRKELDAFDERLKSLHTGLSHSEESINSLQEREKDLGAVGQRTDGLEKRMVDLMGQAEDLHKKQAQLETLRDRLAQVDELTKRTSYEFGALEKSREDLEGLRKEIQEFHKTHAALGKTIAALAADKKSFEEFLRRTDEFRREIPVLDSKMDAITSKLSVVEEGTQKAATLVAVAEDLDRQMTRIAGNQQLIEKVEVRLSTLNTLSSDVEGQMQEQLGRRTEIESLKSICDGLVIQVTDARQQVDGISVTQQKLLPLTSQVAEIRQQVNKTGAAFRELKQEDAAIAAQEKRLAELVDQSREVAADVETRVVQVQELTTELSAGAAIKDELADELGRVQGRQREVTAQVQLSEDQLKRVEQQMRQLHTTLAAGLRRQETGGVRGAPRRVDGLVDRCRAEDAGGRGPAGVRGRRQGGG